MKQVYFTQSGIYFQNFGALSKKKKYMMYPFGKKIGQKFLGLMETYAV